MSIVWLVCGIIIMARRAVPPGLLGGSVRHYVDEPTSGAIGFLLLLPFGFDVLRLLCIGPIATIPLTILYFALTYIWALAAIGVYITCTGSHCRLTRRACSPARISRRTRPRSRRRPRGWLTTRRSCSRCR